MKPRVLSIALAIAIVATWFLVAADLGRVATGFVPNARLADFGGATRPLVLGGGWWRLLASQFLHVYLLHALLNACAIVGIGWRMPSLRAFAVPLLAGGVAGQLAAIAESPQLVASGASQAALALAAAAIVLAWRSRHWSLAHVAIVYTAIQIALDLMSAHRLKTPHLVAFGVGLLAGFGQRAAMRSSPPR